MFGLLTAFGFSATLLSAALTAQATAGASTALPSTALPSTTLPTASYELDVQLNTASHSLEGHGRVELRNATPVALDALYFHLYLNAFKPEFRSDSYFETGRNAEAQPQSGELVLHSIRDLRTDTLIWPSSTHNPAALPAQQTTSAETDLRVALPTLVAAGETAAFELSWTAVLPQLTERTGYVDDFYFAGQWFPKLAKLEPDGTFAHFTFDPRAEFYADFGNYRVSITTPPGYVVGATGQPLAAEPGAPNPERRTYVAERVHDFAWTAWPHYVEHLEQLGTTKLRLLFPRGYDQARERTLQALRFGLPYFEARYGAYPYPQLTLVFPPEIASGAGGMEYPQLITTGGRLLETLQLPLFHSTALEQVTLHELAHQWFYGMLASNEHRFPFLDEGLTTYAENQALEAWLGPASGGKWFGYNRDARLALRRYALQSNRDYPLAAEASEYPNFVTLSDLAYSQTATLLETLRRVFGSGLDAALQEYTAQFRFQHPVPEDLLRVIEKHLGERAATQLRTALREPGWVDYAVRDVHSRTKQGAAVEFPYEHQVEVTRRGNLSFPVELAWLAEDGSSGSLRWEEESSHQLLRFSTTAPLVQVQIDPKFQVLVDQDLLNNSKQLRASLLPSIPLLRTTQGQAPMLESLDTLAFWFSSTLALLGF